MSSLRDPIAAAVIFALSLTAFLLAGNYTGGAELFPRGIAAIMMVCSVLLFVKGVLRPTSGERMSAGEMRRVAFVILMTVLYILAVRFVGFTTASIIFVVVTAYALGIRNYLLIAVSAVVFVGLVSYLFRSIFHVPLPRELILTFF
jgi:putative tricarboxylic transport membrane protein